MDKIQYTIPIAKLVEITPEGILCLSTQGSGRNEDYVEEDFEW